MAKQIVLSATDLDGYLTEGDNRSIQTMEALYEKALLLSPQLNKGDASARESLISLYNDMGSLMQEITNREPGLHVYSFDTPSAMHGEASRLIHKLRDPATGHHEFLYYIQRAYELLFTLSVAAPRVDEKNYLVAKTPVDIPVQNYSVHKVPNVDSFVQNSVMCVMLRGALLPSMIMSKEMQEYSSKGHVSPFALFRIRRDDSKSEKDMDYILDLEHSYFDLEQLQGKDLIFADPMNATGGSLVTIIQYLLKEGVRPKSVQCMNVISALKGSLRVVRAVDELELYTLWMDPVLNKKAYILPGLGDAGDRLNGADLPEAPRNMIQLIADYGSNIVDLYRSQVREIERTVLGRYS